MPKVISEEERALTKQALIQASISLIKSKGLRHVTVADLTKMTGMAKGSFYYYFQSKEELLYEAIRISERKAYEATMSFRFKKENFKEHIERMLIDFYLSPDSLALYLKPVDLEYLMRKLPAEIREQDNKRAQNNLIQIGELFGLQEEDRRTLSYLLDALLALASCEQNYGELSWQKSLEVLIHTIAEFISEKSMLN